MTERTVLPHPVSLRAVAIEAQGLSKGYQLGGETIRALKNFSLQVRSSEFLAVMGPSGSGKSTLLHLLGLLDTPDGGDVIVEGKSTRGLNDDGLTRLRRERLGFVFQAFELIPNLSARENILLPAEVAGRQEGSQRLYKLAKRLGIESRLEHRPGQLSGGQRQRVAVARALINDPAVILADEPTGNLDTKTSGEVLSLLREGVREEGWTVVMVTHNPQAALFADRIVFLKDGELAGEALTGDADVRTLIDTFAEG